MRQGLRLTYSETQALNPEDHAVIRYLQAEVGTETDAPPVDFSEIHQQIIERISPNRKQTG